MREIQDKLISNRNHLIGIDLICLEIWKWRKRILYFNKALYLTLRIVFKDTDKDLRAITAFWMECCSEHFTSIDYMRLLVLDNLINLSPELPKKLKCIFKAFVYCTSGSKSSSGSLSYLGIKVSFFLDVPLSPED